MAFIELLDKLINEHGSATIRGEVIAMLRVQAELEQKKLAEVTAERDRLRTENEALRREVAELKSSTKFTEYRGLLWRKLESGEYEDCPYCPKCKMVMHQVPPPSITKRAMYWSCSPCHMNVGFCKPPDA